MNERVAHIARLIAELPAKERQFIREQFSNTEPVPGDDAQPQGMMANKMEQRQQISRGMLLSRMAELESQRKGIQALLDQLPAKMTPDAERMLSQLVMQAKL